MEVTPALVPVTDRSAVGEVRRVTRSLAEAAHFDEEAAGRAAIVATELASNIVKHAVHGHCFVSVVGDGAEPLVQIVAVDSGPGIEDATRALSDGYSTAGTAGGGLGAVQRLSRSFDLFSQPAAGLVVVARIGTTDGSAAPHPPIEIGAVEAPLQGEPVSGDAWAIERNGSITTLLVADGLGHGPLAAECARAAVAAFAAQHGRTPRERVERVHDEMRGTRGAALAIAAIDSQQDTVQYAGIGNIAAQIVTDAGVQSLVSMNGTVGHVMRTVREFSYEYPPGALLVAHSDGVSARWALERYPGIGVRDPAVIAAVLHRDHSRGRDDATVVVARHGNARPVYALRRS